MMCRVLHKQSQPRRQESEKSASHLFQKPVIYPLQSRAQLVLVAGREDKGAAAPAADGETLKLK